MSAEDQKPDVKPLSIKPNCKHINLKVQGPDDDKVMHFKINRSTQMKKVMNAFYEQQNLTRGSLRFYYNGDRIGEDSTIVDLKLEKEDSDEVIIDVFREAFGGHYLEP